MKNIFLPIRENFLIIYVKRLLELYNLKNYAMRENNYLRNVLFCSINDNIFLRKQFFTLNYQKVVLLLFTFRSKSSRFSWLVWFRTNIRTLKHALLFTLLFQRSAKIEVSGNPVLGTYTIYFKFSGWETCPYSPYSVSLDVLYMVKKIVCYFKLFW